jgi:SAM-dependent methyltransferase
MDASESKSWYESWFDSPYYHILYKHRDDTEARRFIDSLLAHLEPAAGARILDLACGKGRYSIYLANKGFDVTGVDLSPGSIAIARQYEQDQLHFFTHDMREPFRPGHFDYVFNFFTSFGYFEEQEDDLRVLQSVRSDLKPGGTFVLDFFNADYVRRNLVREEVKELEGIRFQLERSIEEPYVYKRIRFSDRGRHYAFEERVRLIGKDDFKPLFREAGLAIRKAFGDYQLHPFDTDTSPRLILLASPAYE